MESSLKDQVENEDEKEEPNQINSASTTIDQSSDPNQIDTNQTKPTLEKPIPARKKCNIRLSSEFFAVLIKFLSLKEIFQKILCLDRRTRQVVCSENYVLIKKFLQLFCINRRLKNSDLFAFVDMIKCIKENVSIAASGEQKQIIPFGYYSDCGAQEDRLYYWI